MVSGLHWTIPYGTSAPGKTLPPPVVHVRVSTSEAGSLTLASVEVSLAAFGRALAARGFGQSVRCPSAALTQVAVRAWESWDPRLGEGWGTSAMAGEPPPTNAAVASATAVARRAAGRLMFSPFRGEMTTLSAQASWSPHGRPVNQLLTKT